MPPGARQDRPDPERGLEGVLRDLDHRRVGRDETGPGRARQLLDLDGRSRRGGLVQQALDLRRDGLRRLPRREAHREVGLRLAHQRRVLAAPASRRECRSRRPTSPPSSAGRTPPPLARRMEPRPRRGARRRRSAAAPTRRVPRPSAGRCRRAARPARARRAGGCRRASPSARGSRSAPRSRTCPSGGRGQPVRTRRLNAARPRVATAIAGWFRLSMPPSKITHTSAPRSSSCRNSTIDWPPTSSSPSETMRRLIGRAPSAASSEAACTSIHSCPLSSATPRAYSHSPRIVASNGSESQSSSGAGGWTS